MSIDKVLLDADRLASFWEDMDKCHHECLHMLKDSPKNLPLKFSQNWVSNI